MRKLYYLHHALENKTYRFADAAALAAFWARKGYRFEDLNVTGRDVRAGFVRTARRDIGGFPVYERVELPRPIHVTDGNGRRVDVRTWDANLFVPRCAPARPGPLWNTGTKQAKAHFRGPTLQRAAMAAAMDDGGLDELEDVRPVRDGSRVRRKAVMNPDQFLDRTGARGPKSNSWKDQTDAPRQYAKHRKGSVRPATHKNKAAVTTVPAKQYHIPDYMDLILGARLPAAV